MEVADAIEVEYHAIADALKVKINFEKYAYIKSDGILKAKWSYSYELVKYSPKDSEIQAKEKIEAVSNALSSSSISS